MLRPKHPLYLHVISEQNPVGYFLIIYAFQALILLAFWQSFQRVPWQIKNTFIIVA